MAEFALNGQSVHLFMSPKESLVGLLIFAAVFYIPVLGFLIAARRSWMDVLVVGAVAFIVCSSINQLIPPIGLLVFAAFHAVWICIGLRSLFRKRKERKTPDQ